MMTGPSDASPWPGPGLLSAAEARALAQRLRHAAVIGASPRPDRPSYRICAYLKTVGVRVSPVNGARAGETLLGQTIVAHPGAIAMEQDPVEAAVFFRRSAVVGAAVDEALAALGDRGLRCIWMQLGIEDAAAAARAEAAGLAVVMDRCVKIEHAHLERNAL